MSKNTTIDLFFKLNHSNVSQILKMMPYVVRIAYSIGHDHCFAVVPDHVFLLER